MFQSRIFSAGVLALAALLPASAGAEEDLNWQFVPGIPRPVEVAIVSGDPSKEGPYVVRYRTPSGMRFAPVTHPDARELTIIKGTYWIAQGESYNWKQMDEFKAGAVIQKEANKPYFGWARTAVILEERGTGPTNLNYVHEDDDPRNHRKD
ncbi:MAG: cupin domain-containing protein [Betaproteobacteria bacterium]|jgi:hypothetical protein|nr:cupin domain-containing protein [Rhodocyclaceae bacterium]MCA3135407.1 cupin domain-containing protein [Rhodocyclaceae bacterium]MCA3143678.1 cupin domain-containing protein [Rhodocyclaceae bacterium]MCA3144446.1 cupin domain-containing protein [Rhodocyclaceae bacterium]MCE2897531.1 cupin domain-containing protein [Betaproteobacteria bacterium]